MLSAFLHVIFNLLLGLGSVFITFSTASWIPGVLLVFITYASGPTVLPIHFILAVLYSAWLIVLKPMSSERASGIQSLLAVFLGTTATTLMSASANSVFPVLLNFLIGFAAARHVLVQGDDPDFSFLSMLMGLIFAEFAWLCQSWLIVYTFKEIGFLLPQSAIVLTTIVFLIGYIFNKVSSDEDFNFSKIATPTIFSLALILIIVLWFSKPLFNV